MEIDSKILKRLDDWEQREGSLPEIVELYRRLLRLQSDIKSRLPVPQLNLSRDEIGQRLRQGISLLDWNSLSLDWPAFQELFRKAAVLAGEYYTTAAGDFSRLADAASDLSFLQEAARAWYEGKPLSSLAAAHSVSEELLAVMIHSAIKPFLATYAEALGKLVEQEQWRRGYCPICGGRPDLAFLDKEVGARWLLCSRCDTQWLFQRLQCPYCSTQDQNALAYFADEEGMYRLYTCEQCHTYLKTIDLRQAKEEILLPLERVLTVDMDRQGREKGYTAGWTSTQDA